MGSIEVGKAPYTLTVGYHSSKKRIWHWHCSNGKSTIFMVAMVANLWVPRFVGFQPLETQGLRELSLWAAEKKVPLEMPSLKAVLEYESTSSTVCVILCIGFERPLRFEPLKHVKAPQSGTKASEHSFCRDEIAYFKDFIAQVVSSNCFCCFLTCANAALFLVTKNKN